MPPPAPNCLGEGRLSKGVGPGASVLSFYPGVYPAGLSYDGDCTWEQLSPEVYLAFV